MESVAGGSPKRPLSLILTGEILRIRVSYRATCSLLSDRLQPVMYPLLRHCDGQSSGCCNSMTAMELLRSYLGRKQGDIVCWRGVRSAWGFGVVEVGAGIPAFQGSREVQTSPLPIASDHLRSPTRPRHDMMKTIKIGLMRSGKKIKHIGHGVQPAQELNKLRVASMWATKPLLTQVSARVAQTYLYVRIAIGSGAIERATALPSTMAHGLCIPRGQYRVSALGYQRGLNSETTL
jgi:hypothetical protein